MSRTGHITLTDLQWHLILIFLILLLLSIPRQPVSPPALEPKAEFLVEVLWDDASKSDVDTWFRAPTGEVIWYSSKQAGLYSIDRDDTNLSNDGPTNREVVSMRGWAPGPYTVNLHLFRMRDQEPVHCTVRVTKLNPFSEVVDRRIDLTKEGQETTVVTFTLDASGKVTDLSYSPVILTRKGANQ